MLPTGMDRNIRWIPIRRSRMIQCSAMQMKIHAPFIPYVPSPSSLSPPAYLPFMGIPASGRGGRDGLLL